MRRRRIRAHLPKKWVNLGNSRKKTFFLGEVFPKEQEEEKDRQWQTTLHFSIRNLALNSDLLEFFHWTLISDQLWSWRWSPQYCCWSRRVEAAGEEQEEALVGFLPRHCALRIIVILIVIILMNRKTMIIMVIITIKVTKKPSSIYWMYSAAPSSLPRPSMSPVLWLRRIAAWKRHLSYLLFCLKTYDSIYQNAHLQAGLLRGLLCPHEAGETSALVQLRILEEE